jgi:mlo protein
MQRLKKSRKKPLYEALLKVKEELMLLGFISLLLNVFQGPVEKVCVRRSAMRHMLPCKPSPRPPRKTEHLADAVFTGVMGGARRLLAGGGASDEYCLKKVLSLINWQRTNLIWSFLLMFSVFFSMFGLLLDSKYLVFCI